MSSDSFPPPESFPPKGTKPRVISVGGGRGGVGKSLLAVNLGVYLAQLGRNVVLADLDPAGSGLHTMFGLPPSTVPAAGDEESEEPATLAPIPTPVPGLMLMPAELDPSGSPLSRAGKQAKWLTQISQLTSDYLLLDLGAGISHTALDLFLGSDVGVCVTVPEPPAIEATYQFLRAVFLRRMRRSLAKERVKAKVFNRAVQKLGPLPNPLDVLGILEQQDAALAEQARAELGRLHPSLAVCQTRIRSDLDLGPAMRAISLRYLGVDLDYLGYVEHDDAVWLTVRRRRPLLIDTPTSKGARNVERIARRVLALATARDGRPSAAPPPALPETLTLYEALGVPRGASDEEVRRASKRQREIYAEGSLPLTSVLWGGALLREQARIEEAHDTLLDPVRRRAYDLSTFPEPLPASTPARDVTSQGADRELLMLQSELAREIHSETQFTGGLLRKVRESQGVDIAEISGRTKISAAHLRAIEDEIFGELPALVYTRGFVQELAKCLRLDPSQVARTYLKRMREALAIAGRNVG
jgi:flagellar biosynthesis protein FlhG